MYIIKDFYYNEVCCNYYLKEFDNIINELESKGELQYMQTLLSKPEQDYFNFLLNKAEFSNGLDLRNSYLHGTQPNDSKIHEQDYFILL